VYTTVRTATAAKTLFIDRFALDENLKWRIEESDAQVDGQHVLARVSGPFFLYNGVSRNNRRYQPRLWENVFKKCEAEFNSGGLLGTVGHDQPIDDKALLEGKISHLVTRLWVEDGVGMGEVLLLNSPGGQILNSIFRAGKKIPVSSRAYGQYLGKGDLGEDIIDPDSFELVTFDFELSPGVDSAYPELKESAEGEQTEMDEKLKLVEQLTSEKIEVQRTLDEALEENRTLRAKVDTNEAELKKAQLALKAYTTHVGSFKELKEALVKWMTIDCLKGVAKEMGVIDHINARQVISVAEKYATEVGSIEQAKKDRAELKEFKAIGTVRQIRALKQLAETYQKLGDAKTVAERMAKVAANEKELRAKTRKDNIAKLSKEFGESEKFVGGLLESMKPDEARKLLKERKSANENLQNLSKKPGKKVENPAAASTWLGSVFRAM